PAVAQAPHGATYHVRLLVEVRNEDEDAAAAVVLGELREWSAELARLAGAGAVERVQDEIEVSGGGRHVLDDVAVERGEPDPVALLVREVREAGGEEAGVAELGAALPAVAHGAGNVQQDRDVGVGVRLELLDVEAVGARVEPPVDAANGVARDVSPVLGEVQREPEVRRAVQPVDEPLDDGARDELEVVEAREDPGVEEAGAGRGVRGGG